MKYKVSSNCRLCGSGNIVGVLEFGDHPLANSLKKDHTAAEDKYPLTLMFCKNCSLVLIRETVDKEILFRRYVWVTGTSSTANKFADVFYDNLISVAKPAADDLVTEIASNDGTFLSPFVKNGFKVVGVDPAENIAETANKQGIKTLAEFWNMKTAEKIVAEYGHSKIIIARNVIPHVSELHKVIEGIYTALAGDGVGVIEFHYAGKILDELQYDSIYHEHLCYFSLKTMEYLLAKFSLYPFHVELSPISGGAYVLYFSKNKRQKSKYYHQASQQESELLVNEFTTWKKFAKRCIEHKDESKKILSSFKDKNIVCFGASARSSTYLNFCEITNRDINAIIDNNPLKQNLYTAGSNIKIVAFSEGLNLRPELIFILAWNFKDEIIRECKRRGYTGSYLIPFPNKPYLSEDQAIMHDEPVGVGDYMSRLQMETAND